MRTPRILIILLACCGMHAAVRAQTATTLTTEGRAALASEDLATAQAHFAAALALDPNHADANALLAITRLLALPDDPAVQAFLTRIGVDAAGRNIYGWSAGLAKEPDGSPTIPSGVSADEFARHWRTNALPVISAAIANLAAVTDTAFLISLTEPETSIAAVDVDYGDLRVLRAGLHFLEFFSLTILAHDYDAQLTVLDDIANAPGGFDLARLLREHPQLLTFSSAADMDAARTAFANMVDNYAAGSDVLRARPAGTTRLFNFVGDGSSRDESRFREALEDLKASLTGAMTMRNTEGDFTVFMGSHFSGQSPLRSLLPDFRGNRMVLGSLPDPTFGGVLVGTTGDEVERFMFGTDDLPLRDIPTVPALRSEGGQPFRFDVRTKPGLGYVVESSADLQQWDFETAFVAIDTKLEFHDVPRSPGGHRFFRVVDRDNSLPLPANDHFENRVHLGTGSVQLMGYNRGASFESGEQAIAPNALGSTVWYSWTAPASATYQVRPRAGDDSDQPIAAVFIGDTLGGLNQVATTWYPGGPAQFNAIAGTTYQIAVDGQIPYYYGYDTYTQGGFRLSISQPPTATINSPTSGNPIPGPTDIMASVAASDPDGRIVSVEMFLGNAEVELTQPPFDYTFPMVPVGNHYLNVHVTDDSGLDTWTGVPVSVYPANDGFASRTSLTGERVVVTYDSFGSTVESGEPPPFGDAGQFSRPTVWWEWTAPTDGTFTAQVAVPGLNGDPYYVGVGIFQGDSLGNLVHVGTTIDTGFGPDSTTIAAMAGSKYILADYGNGSGFNNTLRILPGTPPQVSISSPTEGETLTVGNPVLNVMVSATDAQGDVVSVTTDVIPQLGSPLGLMTDNTAPFTTTYNNVLPGNYFTYAQANDADGLVAYTPNRSFTFSVLPPANDEFGDAITISGGSHTSPDISTIGASKETGEPNHAGISGAASVWWTWTAPKDGIVTIDTIGSDFDTILGVYLGASVGALTHVASDDESGGNHTSRVSFFATGGTTYRIAVDGYFGSRGTAILRLSQP